MTIRKDQMWLCPALCSCTAVHRSERPPAGTAGRAGQKRDFIFHVAPPQDTAENGPQHRTANNISMAMLELTNVKSVQEASTAVTLSSPDTLPFPATTVISTVS